MAETSGIKTQKMIFSGEIPPTEDRLHAQTAAIGANLSQEQFGEVVEDISNLYQLKQTIYLEEIAAAVDEVTQCSGEQTRLMGLQITLGKNLVPSAMVSLRMSDGTQTTTEASGNSSTDAIFSAIQHAMKLRVFLSDFSYGNITQGACALGRATVTVEHHGQHVTARAYSIDMLEAAAKAFLITLNKIYQKRKEQFKNI
jgi:hypothetical protein